MSKEISDVRMMQAIEDMEDVDYTTLEEVQLEFNFYTEEGDYFA